LADIKEFAASSGRLIKEDNTIINRADVLAAIYDSAAGAVKTKLTDGVDAVAVNPDGSLATRPVYKTPVNTSATVSIPISGTGSATISVPIGKRYYVKQVNITKGADVTVTNLTFDGNATGQTATFDCAAVFGDLLTVDTSIVISGSNASATTAESLTIQITGYAVDK